MPVLGRFLELSLPAPDIRASLDFYLALGFSELTVNDIRPRQYAAVTDGRFAIGLRGSGLEEPALTFVQRNVARHVRDLVDAGLDPEFARIADDEFNEAGLRTPDGQLLVLVEAPTWSPGGIGDAPAPLTGTVADVVVRTTDPAGATAFFAAAGFGSRDDGRLAHGALSLALEAGWPAPGPALRFAGPLAAAARARLDTLGIRVARRPQGEVLIAPEGTWLVCG